MLFYRACLPLSRSPARPMSSRLTRAWGLTGRDNSAAWLTAAEGGGAGLYPTLRQARHTSNSLWAEAGVPTAKRQLWMGHSDPKMTDTIYLSVRREGTRRGCCARGRLYLILRRVSAFAQSGGRVCSGLINRTGQDEPGRSSPGRRGGSSAGRPRVRR